MTLISKDLSASADEKSGGTVLPVNFYRRYFKRLLDIAFVVLAAPVALPLIAVMAFLTSRDGSAPFYTQLRVGRNGKTFRMFKMRTMMAEADKLLEDHLASNSAARAEWDETQKLKDDPRITPIGRLMRKSSMDELPQLWNVLIGNMSVIGPRPMMVEQKPLYPGSAYYALRPGITGPWQVSDRNDTTFAARAKYDAEYYQSISLTSDLTILVRTVGVVLRCTGY